MKLSAFLRIAVLRWADLFSVYVMCLLMVYLTDVWKLGYTHAAAIMNIFVGSLLILPIVFSHLADAFLGHFCILLVSRLSFVIGLGLLWMSTPEVSRRLNNCRASKGECIGHHQKELLYAGIALVAIGLAGHLTSLGAFVDEQGDDDDEEDDDTNITIVADGTGCCATAGLILAPFGFVLIPIAGIIFMTFVKSWATRFGISFIFTMVSILIFLSGICSYNYVRPQGSPLTIIFRVFFASASKMLYRRPRDVNTLYERQNIGVNDSLAHTKGLRCLDKAAIKLPQEPLEQKNQWRLCTVTEVEKTKIFIRMIPMWPTFILCGVVSSIGLTFFLEQAAHLDGKVGRVEVPLILFLVLYEQAKKLFSNLYFKIIISIGFADSEGQKHFVPPVGIAVAMIFSVLCCICAAKVENRRLGIVKSHGLIDKPDEKVPMSIFWLLPQVLLLCAMEGIQDVSETRFLVAQSPKSIVKYMLSIRQGLFGAGIMGSALSVYIVGKISEQGRKKSWFQSTLNRSRLDNYYWVLAALSAANFVLYVVMVMFYRYRNSEEGPEGEPEVKVGFEVEVDSDDDCLGYVNCCGLSAECC